MGVWNRSKMETLYHSADESEEYPCIVRIDGEEILIEYDSEGPVQYKGKSKGDGHFVLNAVGFDGRATLHMFAESKILEGSWTEGGVRGMWRISLA